MVTDIKNRCACVDGDVVGAIGYNDTSIAGTVTSSGNNINIDDFTSGLINHDQISLDQLKNLNTEENKLEGEVETRPINVAYLYCQKVT